MAFWGNGWCGGAFCCKKSKASWKTISCNELCKFNSKCLRGSKFRLLLVLLFFYGNIFSSQENKKKKLKVVTFFCSFESAISWKIFSTNLWFHFVLWAENWRFYGGLLFFDSISRLKGSRKMMGFCVILQWIYELFKIFYYQFVVNLFPDI